MAPLVIFHHLTSLEIPPPRLNPSLKVISRRLTPRNRIVRSSTWKLTPVVGAPRRIILGKLRTTIVGIATLVGTCSKDLTALLLHRKFRVLPFALISRQAYGYRLIPRRESLYRKLLIGATISRKFMVLEEILCYVIGRIIRRRRRIRDTPKPYITKIITRKPWKLDEKPRLAMNGFSRQLLSAKKLSCAKLGKESGK